MSWGTREKQKVPIIGIFCGKGPYQKIPFFANSRPKFPPFFASSIFFVITQDGSDRSVS